MNWSTYNLDKYDFRPLDENGGCSFPSDEAMGYSFYKKEVCNYRYINAAMQGCCFQGELDRLFHNDFKSGAEDRFWAGEYCKEFDLGDVSNIKLNGFLIADHKGKKLFD